MTPALLSNPAPSARERVPHNWVRIGRAATPWVMHHDPPTRPVHAFLVFANGDRAGIEMLLPGLALESAVRERKHLRCTPRTLDRKREGPGRTGFETHKRAARKMETLAEASLLFPTAFVRPSWGQQLRPVI